MKQDYDTLGRPPCFSCDHCRWCLFFFCVFSLTTLSCIQVYKRSSINKDSNYYYYYLNRSFSHAGPGFCWQINDRHLRIISTEDGYYFITLLLLFHSVILGCLRDLTYCLSKPRRTLCLKVTQSIRTGWIPGLGFFNFCDKITCPDHVPPPHFL